MAHLSHLKFIYYFLTLLWELNFICWWNSVLVIISIPKWCLNLFYSSSVNGKVALAILSAMIPMGEVILSKEKNTSSFPELMSVMQTLAGAGQGEGHRSLFPAATKWLEIW